MGASVDRRTFLRAAGAGALVGTAAVVTARALIVYAPAAAVRLWRPARARTP